MYAIHSYVSFFEGMPLFVLVGSTEQYELRLNTANHYIPPGARDYDRLDITENTCHTNRSLYRSSIRYLTLS